MGLKTLLLLALLGAAVSPALAGKRCARKGVPVDCATGLPLPSMGAAAAPSIATATVIAEAESAPEVTPQEHKTSSEAAVKPQSQSSSVEAAIEAKETKSAQGQTSPEAAVEVKDTKSATKITRKFTSKTAPTQKPHPPKELERTTHTQIEHVPPPSAAPPLKEEAKAEPGDPDDMLALSTSVVDEPEDEEMLDALSAPFSKPTASGKEGVSAWLKELGLSAYKSAFEKAGFDDLGLLAMMNEDERLELFQMIDLKLAHKFKLRRALDVLNQAERQREEKAYGGRH